MDRNCQQGLKWEMVKLCKLLQIETRNVTRHINEVMMVLGLDDNVLSVGQMMHCGYFCCLVMIKLQSLRKEVWRVM